MWKLFFNALNCDVPSSLFSLIVYKLFISVLLFSSPVFLFVAAQKIAPILMVSVNRISSFCLSSSHSFWPSRLFPCRTRLGTCPASRPVLTCTYRPWFVLVCTK